MVKRKRTNNDLRNITHKTKDRVTRTPLKTRDDLMCSGKVSSSCSTGGANRSGRFICTINVLMYTTNESCELEYTIYMYMLLNYYL
jgi:hypothetical protein